VGIAQNVMKRRRFYGNHLFVQNAVQEWKNYQSVIMMEMKYGLLKSSAKNAEGQDVKL
jgi:hypothetical protein